MSAPSSRPALGGEAVWHDIECAAYEADLGLWLELAGSGRRSTVLDIGCGTGRVALRLAAAGHSVTGLDVEAGLLAALRERASEHSLHVETVEADVRSFDLGRRFDLVLAPMQLLQLLRSSEERVEALRRVLAHLHPGGTFACALLDLDGEVIDSDYLAPLPDMREQDGCVYSSQPIAIRTVDRGAAISLDRLRQTVSPDGRLHEEMSEIRLALVSPADLELEARAAGLQPCAYRHIPPTADYMGSIAMIATRPR